MEAGEFDVIDTIFFNVQRAQWTLLVTGGVRPDNNVGGIHIR
jgi:hypothetical protein